MVTGGFDVETKEEGGVLTVIAREEQEFQSLEGDGTTTAPVKTAALRIRADPEIAKAIGQALLGWHGRQQPTDPPGEKPMHDEYAEVEPDR